MPVIKSGHIHYRGREIALGHRTLCFAVPGDDPLNPELHHVTGTLACWYGETTGILYFIVDLPGNAYKRKPIITTDCVVGIADTLVCKVTATKIKDYGWQQTITFCEFNP